MDSASCNLEQRQSFEALLHWKRPSRYHARAGCTNDDAGIPDAARFRTMFSSICFSRASGMPAPVWGVARTDCDALIARTRCIASCVPSRAGLSRRQRRKGRSKRQPRIHRTLS